MKKGILTRVSALALAATMLTGCSSDSFTSSDTSTDTSTGTGTDTAVTTTVSADTLNIGLYADIISFDSAFAYDFTTNPVVEQVLESILYYDENDELQSYLCESWEEVDETTYVYNMKDYITFSDGTPVTMEDIMYSVTRYADPDLASYLMWMYASVDTIEQTGDWQFTVTLSQPDALWKHTFATTAGMIHKMEYVEAHPDDYGTPDVMVIGTGPYVAESWNVGNQITLSYNENWWNEAEAGEPQVKNVNFLIIPEDTTRVLASTSGQIDINLSHPVDMLADLEAAEDVELLKIPSLGLEYIAFNCQKAPFDDVNVRKAFAYALDAQAIAENIVKDFGTTTNTMPVPQSLFLFEEETWLAYEAACESYDYNMEKAAEALAASAYPDGFDCSVIVDQKSVTNSVALVLQQSVAELGINVTIEKLSNDELVSQQFGSGIVDGVRPYDIGIFEWSSDFPDPSGVLTPLLSSENGGEGGSNAASYSNAEVDALLAEQATLTDTVERTALMLEALDIVIDEVPQYTYTHQNWMFGINDRVTGGVDQLTGSWFWNFYAKNITLED